MRMQKMLFKKLWSKNIEKNMIKHHLLYLLIIKNQLKNK